MLSSPNRIVRYGAPVQALLLTLLCPVAMTMGGCGGGASSSAIFSQGASRTGRASFTVRWPDRSKGRLVPLAANSIVLSLYSATTGAVAQKVLPRPASGDQTTANFDNLNPGDYSVTAVAYPQSDGTGTAQASGSAAFAISSGTVTNVPLTMDTTVASVQILPGQRVLVGQTRAVSVVAKDAQGSVVIFAPAAMKLAVVSGASNLSVDTVGQMKGVRTGTASITATVDGVASPAQTVTVIPAGFLFKSPVDYNTEPLPDVTAAADLDGDGNLDILFVAGGDVGILYGNGDGTFNDPVYISVGGGLAQGIVVDVNGDGRGDLVVCDYTGGRVAVLLNQGSRRYAAPVFYTVGSGPRSVTAGDFDGDGKADLAVANGNSGDVYILRNRGNGVFGTPATFTAGSFPASIYAADVDGDSKQDLIVSNSVSSNVQVFFGNGRGGFSKNGDYGVANGASSFVYADLSGDGRPDIAVSNTLDNSLSVLIGQSGARFASQVKYTANAAPGMMQAADLDGDGNLDIATANNGAQFFSIYPGKGDGTLSSSPVKVTSSGNNVRSLVVGDFDKDGMMDVAVGNESSNTISVFLNAK